MQIQELIDELLKIKDKNATIKVCDISVNSDGRGKEIIKEISEYNGVYYLDFDSNK